MKGSKEGNSQNPAAFAFDCSELITIFSKKLPDAHGVAIISADQLKNDLTRPDVIVIDVRVEAEWNSSQFKIQNAVRESPREVSSWMTKYPKDKTIVLYCD